MEYGMEINNVRQPEETEMSTEQDSSTTGQADNADRLVICDCYPKHCEHGDTCWCEPRVEVFENGNRVIIHNKAN